MGQYGGASQHTHLRNVWGDSAVAITGASRGLGRAVAVAASARGARVGLLARSSTDLVSTLHRCGDRGVAVACDVGDPSATARAFSDVHDALGPIDVLICCAGVGAYGSFTDLSEATAEEVIRVNALGCLHAARAVLPGMLERGRGRIMLVGSIAGRVGVPLEAAYSASKFAVTGLARALDAEVAGSGVSVGVIGFGPIATDFFTARGHAYARRRPKPMPVERAAIHVLRAVERGTPDAIRPRWLRAAVVVDAVAPSLYRIGAARATTKGRTGSSPGRASSEPVGKTAESIAIAEAADLLVARASAENFTVAPRFLPRAWRDDLMTLYRYARLVDWVGDEYTGDRLATLDWIEACVERAAKGCELRPGAERRLFAPLAELIARRDLSLQPLLDLVEANRRDQREHRYAAFSDLLGYCRLSANPVGRLVLEIIGASTPTRVSWSDDVCTALQLVEHWQDVAEDAHAGRIYLPADDRARFGVAEDDLLAPSASPQLRALMLFEAQRAREMLASGADLTSSLDGRARVLVAGFVAGGHAVVDAIEQAGGDVLAHRCRPARRRVAAHTARLLRPGTSRKGHA